MEVKEFTAASFYRFLDRKKLMGSKCKKCGALFLPPRPFCGQCLENEMEWFQFSGRGKLISYSVVRVGTTMYEEKGYGRDTPYCWGLVQLDEGPRISALLLGADLSRPDSITIGQSLEAIFPDKREEEGERNPVTFRLE
ncbi:MAG: Zn-ribbon domain-containing OB-fold protein [Syntrophobacterales bacterium]|nr:MAG: Zn-ribbon domain-containing OB-fold protein [Syntrophobacterales bacterium]